MKKFVKSKIKYLDKGIDKYIGQILFVMGLVIPAWYFAIAGLCVHAVLCSIAAVVLGVVSFYDE
jgi:hypothetical protein